MITVCFFTRGSRLCGYKLSGHAGAGEYGRDIVCAAVSSAAYLTANTLTDCFGVDCAVNTGEGTMELMVGKTQDEAKLVTSDALIKGLREHLRQLREQYPNNVRIITVNSGKEHYYA